MNARIVSVESVCVRVCVRVYMNVCVWKNREAQVWVRRDYTASTLGKG